MWLTDRENAIYTYVKTKVWNKYKNTYSNMFFTQDDSPNLPASFPCIYVHFLSPYEVGSELENTSVNAAIVTVEFAVTVTNAMGLNVANIVSDSCVDALKEVGFEIIMFPEFQNMGTDTKRKIFRARRTIGSGDIIF